MSDPIRIFCGVAANNEDLESQAVLEYTLREHASQPIHIEWMMQSREPSSFWYGWNTSGWATPFSGLRWAVPACCDFQGRAIYMDSDMIVMDDIAKLWNTKLHGKSAMVAKGESERYCVTLFDCQAVRPYMLDLHHLKTEGGAHRTQRLHFNKFPGIVQRFEPKQNWNCLDGEKYTDLHDPEIKCIHYTAIDTQPQLAHAVARLEKDGLRHWFNGSVKTHWRTDLIELFNTKLEEAKAAGFEPERYQREPFGQYDPNGSHGGGWIKPGAKEAALRGGHR